MITPGIGMVHFTIMLYLLQGLGFRVLGFRGLGFRATMAVHEGCRTLRINKAPVTDLTAEFEAKQLALAKSLGRCW